MDNFQLPPEIDETNTDFSKIIKPQSSWIQKIPWAVATFLALVIVALSWQNVTSSDVVYKTILPIVVIYAAAAAWVGSKRSNIIRQPTKIWYKTKYGRGPSRVACTWQGWLIDIVTLLLIFANIVISAIPFSATIDYNSTANPNPHQTSIFFISLTPILLIISLNFWFRNKHSDTI